MKKDGDSYFGQSQISKEILWNPVKTFDHVFKNGSLAHTIGCQIFVTFSVKKDHIQVSETKFVTISAS